VHADYSRSFCGIKCTVDIELFKRAKPSGNLRTGLGNKRSIQLPFGTGYVGSGSDGLGTKLTGSNPLPNETKTVNERPKNEIVRSRTDASVNKRCRGMIRVRSAARSTKVKLKFRQFRRHKEKNVNRSGMLQNNTTQRIGEGAHSAGEGVNERHQNTEGMYAYTPTAVRQFDRTEPLQWRGAATLYVKEQRWMSLVNMRT